MEKKLFKDVKFKVKERRSPKLVSTENEKSNDISWYKKNPNLFNLCTKVNQYHTKGAVHKLDRIYGVNGRNYYAPSDAQVTNPEGMTVFRIEATAGELIDGSSPLNKAMLNFYNGVRGKYTNSVPFQANDMGAYMVSIGSVITVASHIKKLLEVINLYEPDSLLTPYVMTSAFSLDYQNEIREYANNLLYFDLAIKRLSALTIPSSISYFEKCAWQCRYIYREDNGANSRSDLYTMVPKTLLIWSNEVPCVDNDQVKASGLLRVGTSGLGTIYAWINFLNKMIDRLVDDDNVRTISGWIRQYIPDSMKFASDYADFGYEVPAYSEEFKYQILNARVGYYLGAISSVTVPFFGNCAVYAAQNVTKQILEDITEVDTDVTGPSGLMLFSNDMIFNHYREATQDEVMEYTRYSPIAKFVATNRYKYCGDTFFIAEIEKYYNDLTAGISSESIRSAVYQQFISCNSGVVETPSYLFMKVTSNMLPVAYIIELDGDDAYTGGYAYLYDSKFSFVINEDSLSKLHQVAVLSEFETGEISKQ